MHIIHTNPVVSGAGAAKRDALTVDVFTVNCVAQGEIQGVNCVPVNCK